MSPDPVGGRHKTICVPTLLGGDIMRKVNAKTSFLHMLQQRCRSDWKHLSRVMRNLDFCLCENKGTDQLCNYCTADFTTRRVQFLFFLNPKFLASKRLLRLYSQFASRTQSETRKPVFLCHDSLEKYLLHDGAQIRFTNCRRTLTSDLV